MGITDRLSNLRQLLPGAPEEDERLLRLFWSRAELKKELSRLQDERHYLIEQLRSQEGATARAREYVQVLEEYLGNPEIALHALAYFQLRALWRAASVKLGRFAEQLEQQQVEREQRSQLMQFNLGRRQQLEDFDRRFLEARSRADMLEAQLELLEARLAALRGFWNYFRRTRLAQEMMAARAQRDAAVMQVDELRHARAQVEATAPPPFAGISIEGRRLVNTAVIAYAQQLVASLSKGGLAMLAKETTSKRLFDAHYGDREACARLMALLREAMAMLKNESEDLGGLKARTNALRASARYRNDVDTVPLTDTVGNTIEAAASSATGSGPESANHASVNVLAEDYWDLSKALLQ